MVVVVPVVGVLMVVVQGQRMRLPVEGGMVVVRGLQVRGSHQHRGGRAEVRLGREGGGRDGIRWRHDRGDAQRGRLPILQLAVVARATARRGASRLIVAATRVGLVGLVVVVVAAAAAAVHPVRMLMR